MNGSEAKLHYEGALWEFVRIPPGEFLMGSSPTEPGRQLGEIPSILIRITRPFYMCRFLVTQDQYAAVMGINPSRFQGRGLPVDQVQYGDALEYCQRLSRGTRIKVELPTEAQWEYACRAGTTTRYYSGDSEEGLGRIAWYRGNASGAYHAVGKKEPNAWGLFDMLGNLYEPCADQILHFPRAGAADPEGRRSPREGAARGGAWVEPPERCRAASRILTDDNLGPMGIRIVIYP